MNSVSVVIRAYNEEHHIGRLLTGIERQSVEDVQVVLVDSGSTDATRSIAAHYGAEIVGIAPDEFSFGRALNRGLARCRGDFVVVASAHVYPVYEDWIERLIAPFEDERVALTYGRQRGDEQTRFSERRLFDAWFPPISDLDQGSSFCNNANAAVRRELWERRPYDEALTGLEDLEWARWAREDGWRIAYVSEAEIVHVHDERWSQLLNRYRREAIAMKRIFPQERFGRTDFLNLLSKNVVSDVGHAIGERAALRELRGILSFRLAQFWGTYLGYRAGGTLDGRLRRRFYYPGRASLSKPAPASRDRAIDYGQESPTTSREWEN